MKTIKFNDKKLIDFLQYCGVKTKGLTSFTITGSMDDVVRTETEHIALITEKKDTAVKGSDIIHETPFEQYLKSVDQKLLGISPRCIWIEDRIKKIDEAVEQFKETGKEYPKEWLEERMLLKTLLSHQFVRSCETSNEKATIKLEKK